ncbi:nickel ABC transporter permease [Fictibacillus fluitans]|uniref:Nickel import system permease protein NikB n=1 Tax=Fictibacillus fluitans TaxID=3058422 RepID=A0ABT8HTG8_9BACL|nr:nickel ABC transporter permease [Fictibacillus sp. NE201]MDN4524041.1 ABC transporter permease [Fictibacillus sp. NE201]
MTYLLNRIFSGIIVIIGISIFSFFLIHLIPGDPVRMLLGQNATNEEVARLTTYLGLDQPLMVQYKDYVVNTLQGDLGTSIKTGRPVLTEILERFPETMKLAAAGILIATVLGISVGVISAQYKGSFIDKLSMTFATLGVSIPGFWLALVVIMLFSVKLGWLPIAQGTGIRDLILPAMTLGVLASTMISRLTRNGLVEILSNDFVRTARAKGLAERMILIRHALRNALIPVVTVIGLQMAALLGGTVIIEQVFNWPGLGTLAIGAISTRDFPLIQGTILFMGVVYVTINILVDFLYTVIDPRVELSAKGGK